MKTYFLIKTNPLELATSGIGGDARTRRNRPDDQVIKAKSDGYDYALDVAEPAYDNEAVKIKRKLEKVGEDYLYTWEEVNLSDAELASIADAKEEQNLNNVARQAYQALMDGTGTQEQRLVRCERVLARLLKITLN